MRRVSRKDLLDTLYIALTVLRHSQKRALGVDVERMRPEVVETLVYRVMGPPETEAVLLPPVPKIGLPPGSYFDRRRGTPITLDHRAEASRLEQRGVSRLHGSPRRVLTRT